MISKSYIFIIIIFAISGCGSDSNPLPKEDSVVVCDHLFLENQSNYELTATTTSASFGSRNPVVVKTGETKELIEGCDLVKAPDLMRVAENIAITTLVNGTNKTVYAGMQEQSWKKTSPSINRYDFTLTLTDSNLTIN